MVFFRILVIAIVAFSQLNAQDRITGRNFATRSEVIARHGMVATSHPLATQIGLDILKKGGSAVDAAIASNAALGFLEPTGSGIGGDLFAIVWDAKTRQLYGLNASGRSPQRLTLAEFKAKNLTKIPAYGPLPVTVPGCVDGWFELHRRFGRLNMAELLAPTIAYAEQGYPVPELIAYYLERSERLFRDYPNFRETYTIDGKPVQKGDVFRNPALANTYRLLAREGRDAFYKGEIARVIDAFMKKNGGYLRLDDLAAHTSQWVQPISTNYRGYDVWELPPNGQGLAALQMLNILEGYDLAKYGFGSPEHLHFFVEAKKLAFEDRARWYADPAFAEIPVEELLSKDYAAKRRALIQPDRAGTNYESGISFGRETIYLTAADSAGNMVSLIQSNYRGMGSGMVPDGLGFMLHDRGENFDLTEGRANSYAPGKRPFHTIIPGFVTRNGEPFISFGVMGGDFQPLGHVEILLNIIDFGMNIQEAGDAPRIDHSGSATPLGDARAAGGGEVQLESGFSYETIRELMRKGHHVAYTYGTYGGYQAIRRDPLRNIYFGASESRKDGQAAGF